MEKLKDVKQFLVEQGFIKYPSNRQLMLLAIVVMNHRAVAVLKWKPLHAKVNLAKARFILSKMSPNVWVIFPAQTIADYTAAIGDLETKITAAMTRATGTVAARNISEAALHLYTLNVMMIVQTVADTDPVNASSIILDSGFEVKIIRTAVPQIWEVKHDNSGEVLLTCPLPAERFAVEWQRSPDGITWTPSWVTIQASTTVTGLTPGDTLYFRYRITVADGTGAWSNALSIIVI